ncbi:hypothetical protein FQA47_005488 [Oryzias melastigma]|uniref:Uncharacterized protein n=1 Tax=Oryzias melastigma TaxID=30732 RepID=A0A834BMI9_ORYME|nr:hypothetical protein FQA47_005488 [Oryzias melastigma]
MVMLGARGNTASQMNEALIETFAVNSSHYQLQTMTARTFHLVILRHDCFVVLHGDDMMENQAEQDQNKK